MLMNWIRNSSIINRSLAHEKRYGVYNPALIGR